MLATARIAFGAGDEVAVPGDYDGDGKLDPALWRSSSGQWLIKLSGNGEELDLRWGMNGDQPAPADYDGDTKCDLAVWSGRDGVWHVWRSSDDRKQLMRWGVPMFGDVAMPGDYDGDGKADVAVWRGGEGAGAWFIINSTDGAPRVRRHAKRSHPVRQ